MNHQGQVALLLELWFILDRKSWTDLCPAQSEQLSGHPGSGSENHIYGNVASPIQKKAITPSGFFFLPLIEGSGRLATSPALGGGGVFSQLVPYQ